MLYQLKDSGLSETVAKERMKGLLIGPDLETTCIVAFPSKKLVDSRRIVVEKIYENCEIGIKSRSE